MYEFFVRLLNFILLLVLCVNVSWGYDYDANLNKTIDLEIQNQHYDGVSNLCGNDRKCKLSDFQKKTQGGSFFAFEVGLVAAKGAPKLLGHLRIGHTAPWAEMTKAQRRAFQHSYSRHASELGLPKWAQGNADALRQHFNNVVGHIRSTGTNLGTRLKPFDGKSTRVNYFESNLNGINYYYYETLSGQFISAGRAR